MLTFEALVPITLNTKTKGILALQAGERMDVPERVIAQLQEQIPGKIRIIEDGPNWLHAGYWVEFNSPLFGRCTAKIEVVVVDACVITHHSVVKDEDGPVTIPSRWITRIVQDLPTS